jgi:hypothetical protein
VLFTFQDERITESSGLVASSVSDDWFFTHNDSGDDARFYVVDRSGRTLATHTMPGVDASDWEDLARGPDEAGRSSLYLGDIGDNAMTAPRGRRVPRPGAGRGSVAHRRGGRDAGAGRLRPEVRGRRPRRGDPARPPGHRPALRRHQDLRGQASLYAAPVPLRSDGPNVLTRVADLVFTTTGTPGGEQFGPGANLATTGGDISPSGDRVAVRTYTDLYEWTLEGTDVAAALQPTRPRQRTALPPTVQGEAAAYTRDGRSVLVSTEGKGAPVHLLAGAPPPAAAPAAPQQGAPTPPPADRRRPWSRPLRRARPSRAHRGRPWLLPQVRACRRRARPPPPRQPACCCSERRSDCADGPCPPTGRRTPTTRRGSPACSTPRA